MIDIDTLKAHTNLAALIESDLGPPCAKSGRWYLWRCPFHADTDPSLAVTPDTGTYHCFGCGASGDVITWVQEREGLDFREACERLGALDLPDRPVSVKEPSTTSNDGPPPAEWQDQARDLLEICEAALWGDLGKRALAWLRKRGLQDDTIHRWHLGYNAADQRGNLGWLPRGIVITCKVEGTLWYIKIRRPTGRPKYQNVAGSKAALFGADNLEGHDVAVITEGEFDAMLLDQETGDLVGVASLGGAGKRLDTRWIMYLLDKRRVLAAYDTDSSGLKGAAKLLAQSERVRTIRPLEGNDVTDYYLAGGRLRDWVEFHLGKLEHETGQMERGSLRNRLEVDWGQVSPESLHADDPCYLERFLGLLAEYEKAEDHLRAGQGQAAAHPG